MPVFYRGQRAHITHRYFEVWSPLPRRFAVSELRGVHVALTEPDRTGAGGNAIQVAARGWWRRRIHSYVLCGFYRGSFEVLFGSTDERMFEQVRRAVVRAIEYHRDPR